MVPFPKFFTTGKNGRKACFGIDYDKTWKVVDNFMTDNILLENPIGVEKIRVLSLFSGGGGLDVGFEKAGYNIVFATDIDKFCCDTLLLNRGITLSRNTRVVCSDIRKISFDEFPTDIDIIIGGPPCQSFSASGRRAGGAAGRLDDRGTLFEAYCQVISVVQPKAFLFENVRGILATNGGNDFRAITSAFNELGYSIDYRVLDALDYGVPQQRERIFIIGHKEKQPFLFPAPLYGPDSPSKCPHITVEEAIKDIELTEEEKVATEFVGGKYSHLLPLVPHGENYLFFTAKRGYPDPIFAYRSRFSDFLYKANPKAPVKTLIASPGKYTGPLHWDNRYLSVDEYKRIQGFPDKHVFCGKREEQIRQIGNSVCPKIAYYIALAIKKQIFGHYIQIELLEPTAKLSFDKRKGIKAQKTRALHQMVIEKNNNKITKAFEPFDYTSFVSPTTCKKDNVVVTHDSEGIIHIKVESDNTCKTLVDMELEIFDGINLTNIIKVKVSLYGDSEFSVQTMWNALDEWVRKTSNFHSLIELYGHFTEPHPIFRIANFYVREEKPILKFAEHCVDFNNCSRYFPKQHLIDLFGLYFAEKNFVELVKKLRSYRFDIRCYETNIAIPKDVYMVAYPFSLPVSKQMNFEVKERGV